MTAERIKEQLEKVATPEKRDFLPYFFKTGKGEYGEGDKFLGVVVPDIRKIAKANKGVAIDEIGKLIEDEFHECRMCALLILIEQFKSAKEESGKKQIVEFYLAHTQHINNWDLVDLSCRDIIGAYLLGKDDHSLLYRLAGSDILWEQRIAVVSTYTFIKHNDFADILRLSEMFLVHKHDLMHKAVGWMLREAGKMDKQVLITFLGKHYKQMPRTMLRYAIEKLSPEERAYYMKKD
jgi:3-methyladenine DNA glycosylase AlkD